MFMFMGWCFESHLALCVETGTKTSIFNRGLVVYVHGMVLLIATCTSMHKQAPKQTYL